MLPCAEGERHQSQAETWRQEDRSHTHTHPHMFLGDRPRWWSIDSPLIWDDVIVMWSIVLQSELSTLWKRITHNSKSFSLPYSYIHKWNSFLVEYLGARVAHNKLNRVEQYPRNLSKVLDSVLDEEHWISMCLKCHRHHYYTFSFVDYKTRRDCNLTRKKLTRKVIDSVCSRMLRLSSPASRSIGESL